MKIGILTYFGDLNMGTNLQALSTYQAIKNVFNEDEVEVINFHFWRNINLPYLRGGISIRSILLDLRRIFTYRNFKKENLEIKEKDKIISDVNSALKYIDKLNYDYIFIGADTVLELDRVKNGLTPYWLSKEIKAKKFFIAASSKNISYSKLSIEQKKLINESVRSFSFCGVRDEATYKLMHKFVDSNKLLVIPDPTFSMKIDYRYVENYLKRKPIEINRPIVGLHLMYEDSWGQNVVKKLTELGYLTASFRPNRYTDYCLNDLSPLEQMGIYKYFALMITHRFHDTVFCLKNGTPMITYLPNEKYINSDGKSKYSSLLNEFNLIKTNYIENKKYINTDTIEGLIINAKSGFEKNLDSIHQKLLENEKKYYNYLKKVKSL